MFGVDLREQNYVYIHFQLNRHTLIRSWRKLNTSRIDRTQSAYHCCIRDSPQIITINCFPSTIETYYHFGSNAEFDVIAVASGRFARLPPKAAHVPRASTHLPARANHLWRALQRTVTEFTSTCGVMQWSFDVSIGNGLFVSRGKWFTQKMTNIYLIRELREWSRNYLRRLAYQ